MELFLTKQSESKGADNVIVVNAIALETVVLIENPNLLDEFYNWKKANVEENAKIKTIDDLLLNGVFCSKTILIRNAFKDNIELIAEKITISKGTLPLYYLIKMLKDNMPSPDLKMSTKDSAEFFKLLGALII